MSKRAYTDEELKNLSDKESEKHPYETIDKRGNKVKKEFTRYEATQEQRRMETSMRRTRSRAVACKAGGNGEAYRIEKLLYRQQRAEYEKFSKAMELKPDWNRVTVDGLGRI